MQKLKVHTEAAMLTMDQVVDLCAIYLVPFYIISHGLVNNWTYVPLFSYLRTAQLNQILTSNELTIAATAALPAFAFLGEFSWLCP